jgi:hypothetical protein
MELPYIAGLFDGEGSVSITKPSERSDRYRVIVQIAMTHKPTVDAVQAEFGGRVQTVKQSVYNSNARDRYDWRLQDSAAVEFLRSIRPWLVTKATAADIAVRFPFNARGQRVTDDQRAAREGLRLELKEANRRGNA